jgi:hypothetical protein
MANMLGYSDRCLISDLKISLRSDIFFVLTFMKKYHHKSMPHQLEESMETPRRSAKVEKLISCPGMYGGV